MYISEVFLIVRKKIVQAQSTFFKENSVAKNIKISDNVALSVSMTT